LWIIITTGRQEGDTTIKEEEAEAQLQGHSVLVRLRKWPQIPPYLPHKNQICLEKDG